MMQLVVLLLPLVVTADPLGPGDHVRNVEAGGQTRSYIVHTPPNYDAKRPTPVVLAFHGAGTNAAVMAVSTGLSRKADDEGFVVVYPNGTGTGNVMLIWNSGGFSGPNGQKLPDDVAFVARLLDDLATIVNVDSKRVYATGMSNGGMMCYRLAAELSDRIAAIAPVSGTMAVNDVRPQRPVPVIHFHGTGDQIVPFNGINGRTTKLVAFKSVDETIQTWVKLDGCPAKPKTTTLPDKEDDGTTVSRDVYGPGKKGAEVILITIHDGGHTWPGRTWPVPFLGKTTRDISANDLLWEFFKKHPMK